MTPIATVPTPGLTAPVEALRVAVDGLVALATSRGERRVLATGDPSRLDDEQAPALVEALVGVTSAIGRLQAVQLELAERVEACDGSREAGWASTKDLLTHLTGGHKGAGGGILRVAEQTRALPEVRAGMLAGEVSIAQARAIGRRVTTIPAAPGLREQAAGVMVAQVRDDGLDATDLDRSFASVLKAIDPDGSLLEHEHDTPRAERAARGARYLSLTPDEVGGVRLAGYACAEDAELIRTTLAPLAAPVPAQPGSDGHAPEPPGGCGRPGCDHSKAGPDQRDHGVRIFDALIELCRRAQAADDGDEALPRTHGTTARITVTIGLDALRDEVGTGLLGSDQTLSAAACRRLACDAEIIPAVLGSRSQVLDLGRSQRLVSTALWHALVLRDRHCGFPGCTRPPRACDAHHLIHWADGGPTDLDNLTLLCRRHHTLTHASPWDVSLDPVTRRPVWSRPAGPPGTPQPPGRPPSFEPEPPSSHGRPPKREPVFPPVPPRPPRPVNPILLRLHHVGAPENRANRAEWN